MQTKKNIIASLIGMAFAFTVAGSALAQPHYFGNHGQHAQQRHEAANANREQRQHKGSDERKPQLRDPGVNQRQAGQHGRIEQGIRSGQLTREEVKQLAIEQKSIRQEERQYKSDGVLTKNERKDLHQDLSAASKDIYSEKHDAEHR